MSKIVNFRVSEQEYKRIKTNAKLGTMSDYLRGVFFEQQKTDKYFKKKKIFLYLFIIVSVFYLGSAVSYLDAKSERLANEKSIEELSINKDIMKMINSSLEHDSMGEYLKIWKFNESKETNPIGRVYVKHNKDTLRFYLSNKKVISFFH